MTDIFCAHCGKAKVVKISRQTWLYYDGKHFCSIQHFNAHREVPVFDPRKLRPEAFAEQKRQV